MQRTKKPTFILKVDSNFVDTKYEFNLVSNINTQDISNLSMKTSITELSNEPDTENQVYTYLDESKQSHSCCVTMSDLLSSESLPRNTKVKCFWCKHCFETSPIGCPVAYLANKVTKTYHSEITKDEYKITDNLTKERKEMLAKLLENHDSQFKILDNHTHYYVIDGIFCSFNCLMSFVKQHNHNTFYSLSESLTYSLYQSIFGTTIHKIKPAPHWRLLTDYGGHLSIKEFRESFNTITYTDINDYITRAPPSKIIGKLYEKKVKF